GNLTTVTDQTGRQRKTYSDGLGRLIRVDEPSGPVQAMSGTGSVTVSGSEQTYTNPRQSAASRTGTWTISGSGRRRYDLYNDTGLCHWNNDYGTITITVNGYSKSVSYAYTSTAAGLASSLASLFQNGSGSPVYASSSGGVITFTARTTGAATNYSLTSSSV